MTDTPELKPCPFCGGEASHNDGGNSVYGRYWWVVGCKNCDVTFADQEVWSKTDPGMLDPAYPPKHCFIAWNTRAEKVDALVAAKDAEIAKMQKLINDLAGYIEYLRAELRWQAEQSEAHPFMAARARAALTGKGNG